MTVQLKLREFLLVKHLIQVLSIFSVTESEFLIISQTIVIVFD